MKIHNVRLGHANNSSSSHSLIFMDKTNPYHDSDVGNGEFGWNHFVAASKAARRDYLAITLEHALNQIMSSDLAGTIVNQWLGTKMQEDWTIDHQSVYCLPRNWDGNGLDRQFWKEFKTYLLQENLAILGGNDNDNYDDESRGFTLPVPQDTADVHVARKDSQYDYWTIFNRRTGAKIRFSWSNLEKVPITKASAPELIDVKITDFCTQGCDFCYQGSEGCGQHANTYKLQNLAYALEEMKVFEVAIGGGEPTTHPGFIDILRAFRRQGIVPNFTTRDLSWLHQPAKWIEILKEAGSLAYSIRNPEEIANLMALLQYNGLKVDYYCSYGIRVSLQIVMGTVDEWTFRHILQEARKHGLRVTLLGFKKSKRGANYKPEKYDWWLNAIDKSRGNGECPSIAIDTALAKEYEQALIKREVSSILYHTDEGKFSCYIDAVRGKIGPSSYCDESEMKDLNLSGYGGLDREIKKAFAEF